MKGYKFYLEYPSIKDKRKATRKALGNHSGNVLAVFGNWYKIKNLYYKKDCISGVTDKPNSECCGNNVCDEYLLQCKRIGEKQAREIHPNLFYVLDSN